MSRSSGGRRLAVLLICSVFFQFLAGYLSLRFVLLRRLGRPWLLVSAALLIVGGMRIYSFGIYLTDPVPDFFVPAIQMIEFSVSFLLGVGFALTERWYILKERLEGRFRLIADVDRALIGVLDEDQVLSAVCEGLARGQGYRLVWIGRADPDGSVAVLRSAGEEKEFLAAVPMRWDDSPEGRCPPGEALRTGEPCVVNRLRDDPSADALRDAAYRRGLRSLASVRIDVKRSSPLVLTIASGRENAFDPLEMEAALAMAYRVGTAVFSARRHDLFVCAKRSYGDLLHSQRDGVVIVRGGAIVRVNPAAIRMLGYASAEDLLGKDPGALFPQEGLSPEVSHIFRPIAPDREHLVVARMQRRDGSLFEGELAATWVPRTFRSEEWETEYSGPIGLFVFRDVTLRNQTLEELRKERDFSAKVLDVAGVMVLQIGAEGEILLFNRRCEEVTGYTAAEAVGRRMGDLLLPAAERDPHRRSLAEILNGRIPLRLEFPVVTRSGEERTVVWTCTSIPGPDGGVGSVLAAGNDVTERRRLERAIVGMQKMEAVGTLAGGIAHDFNNLLTGILGNLDLARSVLPAESAAASPIEESVQASERAAQLIRQLLDFSRRSPLVRRVTDPGKMVREAAHLFVQTIDRRIEVAVAVADDLWHAEVDAGQVHQVLMNLCANARDAVMERLEEGKDALRAEEEGRIWIRGENVTIGEEYCRAFPYARPGDFVLLSVADNGVGMDEATQRRIFEPFFTTKDLGRGTGLGLSTVYGIVKQHEGWITQDSAPGTGSTFRCYFPRSTASPEETAGQQRGAGLPRGGETILLVDDEELIRDLGRQILQMQGYKVLTAGDGREAVDTFLEKKEQIALVLLDLTMPHLSGTEVLARIRGIDPGAKVILSSGYRADETHRPERLSEASAFLPKPYRADALLRIVREVLDRGTP